jgi:hypothetical protein
VAQKLELVIVEQVLDVGACPGEEIVETHELVAVREEAIAEVGAEKASTAGHEDSLAHLGALISTWTSP